MKQKKANKARTNLLTFISKESFLYLRNNCSMKINSKTTEEILSQFESFEVQINHSPVTGITTRSTHAISSFTQRTSITSLKFDEDNISDEITICSELSNYVDEMDNRKVLFSKNKLKRHYNMSGASSGKKEKQIKIKDNYNNKKSNIDVIKNGMLTLRRILNRIKLTKVKKENIKKSTNLIRPHKKPLSMQIKEMKREIYTTKKKNTYNQNMKNMIFSSNDNNEYEFKINLLKIEGDAYSDNETNDNDTLSNASNKLYFKGSKRKQRKNKIQFDDSSLSNESESS